MYPCNLVRIFETSCLAHAIKVKERDYVRHDDNYGNHACDQ